MFRAATYLLLLCNGFIGLSALGDHATSDSSPSRGRYLTNGSGMISPNDCDEHSYTNYSGITFHKTGEKDYTGSQPPFSLFEQKIETEAKSSNLGDPRLGAIQWNYVFTGYHNGLHTNVFKNFATLLSHALECQSKGNTGYE